MRCFLIRVFLALFAAMPVSALAGDFQPDPRAVQRYGPAYRYPQAGWIVLHIEGNAYERGIQHGRLLAPEIAAYVRCLAAYNGPKAPTEAWDSSRDLVRALFLRGFTREQLEEMKGIADGASGAGARFDGRALDVVDIAALNAANELDSLPAALDATATGLEDFVPPPSLKKTVPAKIVENKRRARPERCCAFAAVGPATKGGELVFGHITMFDLYPANFYNIWLDIKPSAGHAFVMQTSPGGMHSGMDYSINDAGILLSETTLQQTSVDVKGTPLAARIRQAEQYADTIEQAAEILTKNGNGLSSTEWILADARKNEIALLTLGTHASKLYRSSQKEWIDGAEGFYWSCNNNKDLAVRKELVPGMTGRPSASPVFAPARRDTQWLLMADRQKGKIDADFARTLLTTPELVWSFSVDAMYTTGDMAKEFKTWASFGPPVGAARMPSFAERQKFPEVQPLVSNPWAVLHAVTPAPRDPKSDEDPPSDLSNPESDELAAKVASKKEADPVTPPAWHGTLLPKTDADIWLATGFADYERIVALEHFLKAQRKNGEPEPGDLDEVGVELAYHRSEYELGARGGKEVPLAETHATARDVNWFRVTSNKGVMLLAALRGVLGEEGFDKLMDDFGRAHAGKEVTTADFQAHLEKSTGRDLTDFFDPWLYKTGLPEISLGNTEVRRQNKRWRTSITLNRDDSGMMLAVPVTIETESDELTQLVRLDKTQATVEIGTNSPPLRVIVDKYGLSPHRNAPPFTILSFDDELGSTIIVYGSLDEATSNHEAAVSLQQALRKREHNITARVKKDTDVTDADIKANHLLLIGRPNSNALAARFADRLPVHFGSQSFEVRGDVYAHPGSVAIMAIENPLNRRYSIVVLAGLSSLATLSLAPAFEDDDFTYAPVLVLPNGQEEQAFTVPAKELTRELAKPANGR